MKLLPCLAITLCPLSAQADGWTGLNMTMSYEQTEAGDQSLEGGATSQFDLLFQSGSLVYGLGAAKTNTALTAESGFAIKDFLDLKLLIGHDTGRLMPYLTGGFSQAQRDGGSEAHNGYSAGIGLRYRISHSAFASAELLQRTVEFSGSDETFQSLSLGIGYRF